MVYYNKGRRGALGKRTASGSRLVLRTERKGDRMKLLVKLLAVIAALAAAAVAIALLLEKEQRPEYISIYDQDEDETPF